MGETLKATTNRTAAVVKGDFWGLLCLLLQSESSCCHHPAVGWVQEVVPPHLGRVGGLGGCLLATVELSWDTSESPSWFLVTPRSAASAASTPTLSGDSEVPRPAIPPSGSVHKVEAMRAWSLHTHIPGGKLFQLRNPTWSSRGATLQCAGKVQLPHAPKLGCLPSTAVFQKAMYSGWNFAHVPSAPALSFFDEKAEYLMSSWLSWRYVGLCFPLVFAVLEVSSSSCNNLLLLFRSGRSATKINAVFIAVMSMSHRLFYDGHKFCLCLRPICRSWFILQILRSCSFALHALCWLSKVEL